jgi:hypothetical protein
VIAAGDPLLAAAVATFPGLTAGWQSALLRFVLGGMVVIASVGATVLVQQSRAAKAAREAERHRPIPGMTAPRDVAPPR